MTYKRRISEVLASARAKGFVRIRVTPEMKARAAAALRDAEVPGAAEAMDYFGELNRATDADSRHAAKVISELTMPDLLALKPVLKPVRKKRGRKPGRRKKHAEVDAQAEANLRAKTGREPSVKALAREIARLEGITDEDKIAHIERDLFRARTDRK